MQAPSSTSPAASQAEPPAASHGLQGAESMEVKALRLAAAFSADGPATAFARLARLKTERDASSGADASRRGASSGGASSGDASSGGAPPVAPRPAPPRPAAPAAHRPPAMAPPAQGAMPHFVAYPPPGIHAPKVVPPIFPPRGPAAPPPLPPVVPPPPRGQLGIVMMVRPPSAAYAAQPSPPGRTEASATDAGNR